MTALRTLWAWLQGLPTPAPTPTTLGPTLAPPAAEDLGIETDEGTAPETLDDRR